MKKLWAGIGRFFVLSILVYLYFAVREFFDVITVELGFHAGLGAIYLAIFGIVGIVASGIYIIIDCFD